MLTKMCRINLEWKLLKNSEIYKSYTSTITYHFQEHKIVPK